MSGLVVVASMWGTLTTISPTNPLIRWPELAKSNLGKADGGEEQRRKETGGWKSRGHYSVRVNKGTRKLPSLDHHPNDRDRVDCCVAKADILQKEGTVEISEISHNIVVSL